mgnify:CR=1 FL=1
MEDCINGIVEAIVFKSDDTGYVVTKIRMEKEVISAVGVVPFIKEGQHVKLKGQWIVHKQFGRQFNIEEYEEILPNSTKGIERYLSTGVIRGIGPITAKRLVERFKEKTLEILDNDIDKIKEVEGIGQKKFEIIKESYLEQRDLKDIVMFFQGHGMSTNQCIKIYKTFGENAKEIILENPYILSDEISGIGFITADRIAKSIGVQPDSPFRIQSGIRYILNQFSANGNTYMPKDDLTKEASKILGASPQMVEESLYNLSLDSKIKVEKIDGIDSVFSLPYYYCELGVTNRIITLSMENFQLYRTNILLGGQMKLDLILDPVGDKLSVTDMHLSPISPHAPYPKYSDENLLNYKHQDNIKMFYKNTEGTFFDSCINQNIRKLHN